MPVGVLEVRLRLPGTRTLKEKRSVVAAILARTRREFNVSAAELDGLDDPKSAVLGFAYLSNARGHTDEVLMRLLDALDGNRDYYVEGHDLSVL
ncbi:MAG: hypothetical protein BIP78_1597 [Candidatus Bipolaricaulis sibiricus]|uniref:YlxP-like protein n=1 Tax=Bipolaricaulis sibiricus TaxID=2501609 RepID=A0A410FWM4_BIPS1|nr:MAG: hypothetical protein BIP78_1597 [Candidatus Bipolaricaulis sibiricus]